MRAVGDPHGSLVREPVDAMHDLAELLAFGAQFVELVSDEDLDRCQACRLLVGRILPAMSAPLPPIVGCTGTCGCRLAPLSLE